MWIKIQIIKIVIIKNKYENIIQNTEALAAHGK